jgi:hypothetical protein
VQRNFFNNFAAVNTDLKNRLADYIFIAIYMIGISAACPEYCLEIAGTVEE